MARVTATEEQTTFDLIWQATDSGTISGNFVVFVITELLPFAPLKVKADEPTGPPDVVMFSRHSGIGGYVEIDGERVSDHRSMSTPNYGSCCWRVARARRSGCDTAERRDITWQMRGMSTRGSCGRRFARQWDQVNGLRLL